MGPISDFTIKAHDRLPSISATLVDADQAPVDLTGADLTFIMANSVSKIVKVNADGVLVDAANGLVRYDWLSIDTATPGEYVAEWQVTYADGKQQTFPSNGYNSVSVIADLDDA